MSYGGRCWQASLSFESNHIAKRIDFVGQLGVGIGRFDD